VYGRRVSDLNDVSHDRAWGKEGVELVRDVVITLGQRRATDRGYVEAERERLRRHDLPTKGLTTFVVQEPPQADLWLPVITAVERDGAQPGSPLKLEGFPFRFDVYSKSCELFLRQWPAVAVHY
jgi:hypothetical protein